MAELQAKAAAGATQRASLETLADQMELRVAQEQAAHRETVEEHDRAFHELGEQVEGLSLASSQQVGTRTRYHTCQHAGKY